MEQQSEMEQQQVQQVGVPVSMAPVELPLPVGNNGDESVDDLLINCTEVSQPLSAAEVALKATAENAEMKDARLKRRFLAVEEYLTKSLKRTKLSKHFVSYKDISHLPDLLQFLKSGNKRLTVCKLCLQKNIDDPTSDTTSKSGLLNKWEFAMSDSSTTVLNRHMMSMHGVDMSLDTSDVSFHAPDGLCSESTSALTSPLAVRSDGTKEIDLPHSNVISALETLAQSSLTSIGRANKKRKSLGAVGEGDATTPATPKIAKKMTVDRFFQLEALSRLLDCNDPELVSLAKEQLMGLGGLGNVLSTGLSAGLSAGNTAVAEVEAVPVMNMSHAAVATILDNELARVADSIASEGAHSC